MKSAGGTLPRSGCCQRSSASKPTICARHLRLRLIVQAEFAAIDGKLDVSLQRAAFLLVAIHLRIEETEGASTFRLGTIERGVGVAHERKRIGSVVREHSNADGEADFGSTCRRH